MLDLNNYRLVADLSNNKLRKNGFSFGCYRRSVYKDTIEFRLYIDLEEQDVFYQVFDSDHNQLYIPYYNREYGNNKIVKEIDRKINRIMKTMVNQKVLKKTKEEIVGQEDVSVLVETKMRNNRQEVVGTGEQYVPGVRTTYREYYTCKHCGNVVTRDYTKSRAKM